MGLKGVPGVGAAAGSAGAAVYRRGKRKECRRAQAVDGRRPGNTGGVPRVQGSGYRVGGCRGFGGFRGKGGR